jgi:hypothetical protein
MRPQNQTTPPRLLRDLCASAALFPQRAPNPAKPPRKPSLPNKPTSQNGSPSNATAATATKCYGLLQLAQSYRTNPPTNLPECSTMFHSPARFKMRKTNPSAPAKLARCRE